MANLRKGLPMTVAELTLELQRFPQDAKVAFKEFDGRIGSVAYGELSIVNKKYQQFFIPENYSDGEEIVIF